MSTYNDNIKSNFAYYHDNVLLKSTLKFKEHLRISTQIGYAMVNTL